jgi:hypothetical protein
VLENAIKEIFGQLDTKQAPVKTGGAYQDATRGKVSKPDFSSSRTDLFYPPGIKGIVVQGDQGNFVEVKSGKEIGLKDNEQQIRAFIDQVYKLSAERTQTPSGETGKLSTEPVMAFITCSDTVLSDTIYRYGISKKVVVLQYTCQYRTVQENGGDVYEIRLQEPITKEIAYNNSFWIASPVLPSLVKIGKPGRSVSPGYIARLKRLGKAELSESHPDPDEYTPGTDMINCIAVIESCSYTDKKDVIPDPKELGLQEKASQADKDELLEKISDLAEFSGKADFLKVWLEIMEYRLAGELNTLLTDAHFELLEFKIEELKNPPPGNILWELLNIALILAPYLKIPATLVTVVETAVEVFKIVDNLPSADVKALTNTQDQNVKVYEFKKQLTN